MSQWWPCCQYCTNALVTAVLGTVGFGWRLVVVGALACQQFFRSSSSSRLSHRAQASARHWSCLSLWLSVSLPLTLLSSSSFKLLPPEGLLWNEALIAPVQTGHNIPPPPPPPPLFQRLGKPIQAIWLFRLLLKITFLDYIQFLGYSQTFSWLSPKWLWASQSKTMALYLECLWLAFCKCSAPFLLAPVNCSKFHLDCGAPNHGYMHLHCVLTAGDICTDPE